MIEIGGGIESAPVILHDAGQVWICWEELVNGNNSLCGVRYTETDGWSEKMTHISGEFDILDARPALKNGKLVVSYMRASDMGGEEARFDLYYTEIEPGYKLELPHGAKADAALLAETLMPTEEEGKYTGSTELTFELLNAGQKPVEGVVAEIWQNTKLKTIVLDDISLNAGESTEVTLATGVVSAPGELTIKVIPNESQAEAATGTAAVLLGNTDAAVISSYISVENGEHWLNAELENKGTAKITALKANIHAGDKSAGTI